MAAGSEAVAIEGEAAAMNTASIATKAFATAKNMLINAGIAIAISLIAKAVNELITAEERARKAAEEHKQQLEAQAQTIINTVNNIDQLIERYEQYKGITDLTSDEKKDLLKIQEELNKAFDDESNSLDLLNDKYDENIKKIRENKRELAYENHSAVSELYKSAYKEAADNDALNFGKDTFVKTEIASELDSLQLHEIFNEFKETDEIAKRLSKIEGVEIKPNMKQGMYEYIINPQNSVDAVKTYEEVYETLFNYVNKKRDELSQEQIDRIDEMMADVQERQAHYLEESQDVKKYAELYAENLISWANLSVNGQTLNFDNVTKDTYRSFRDALIKEFATEDPLLQDAIDELLKQLHPEEEWQAALEYGSSWEAWIYGNTKFLPESIATFNDQFDEEINNLREKRDEYQNILKTLTEDPNADLSEFYQKNVDLAQYDSDRSQLQTEIFKKNAEAVDELTKKLKEYKEHLVDENGLPIEEDQKKVEALINTIENWKYLDNIDDAVKQVVEDFNTLKDAADKLANGDYEATDLQALFESFPELKQYAGDINKLTEKTKELGETKATNMLLFLNTLKETATDPEVIKSLNALISLIERLGYTKTSWLEYETGKIDDIIDGLEEENDKLQEQLDLVDEMISKYEAAGSTVDNYIDKQIKALEDEKQAIEDDYDAQIKAIQDKNKEREQEINLQEKLDALLNAKKKRVMVYSETNGWKLQRDSTAIAEAQKEYDQAVDDKKIADLEKERDVKTKVYDDQIKSWQEYLDWLTEKMDAVKNVSDEKATAEVLGIDWREKINQKDKGILNGLISNYDTYLNKKKVQLEQEKADNDSRIKLYQGLKDEMEKAVDGAVKKNDEYLDSLEKVRIDEISNYGQREAYLQAFLKVQDRLMNESEYGQWLLGKKTTSGDTSALDGKEVTYNGNQLVTNFSVRGFADKAKELLLKDSAKNAKESSTSIKTFTNNENYQFQFFGDIVGDGQTVLNTIAKYVQQQGLNAKIGK